MDLEIRAVPTTHRKDPAPTKTRETGPHDMEGQRILVGYSEGIGTYSRRETPPSVRWSAPSAESWLHLDAIAWILFSELEHLLDRGQHERSKKVTPPWKTLLNRSSPFLLGPSALAGGIGAIILLDGWVSFVAFFLLCFVVAPLLTYAAVTNLRELRAGCMELVGNLDKKWNGETYSSSEYYIRVSGLPFAVSRNSYDSLSEGSKVQVTYWAQSKKQSSLAVLLLDRSKFDRYNRARNGGQGSILDRLLAPVPNSYICLRTTRYGDRDRDRS